LDTPEHVDSEKLNRQIDLGPDLYQLFSKRDLNSEHVAKIGYNWQNLTDFQTFFGYFHVLQVVEHTRNSFGTNTVKK
jgi:hypothetical protein